MSGYVAQLLAEADKIRAKIENDEGVMEKMRMNQIKSEEKLKAEVARNVALKAKEGTLEETLVIKEEIINDNNATIKRLRTEVENLNKKLESTVNTTSAKRKQKSSSERSTKMPRVSPGGFGYFNNETLVFITAF